MKRKIIVTADNSKTLLIPELNETYHSTKGALTESKHVFIQEGLLRVEPSTINIFEMGFGTGLNAILTFEQSEKEGLTVQYDSLEAYPLDWETVKEVGYQDFLSADNQEIFREMHDCPWERNMPLGQKFIIHKIHQKLSDYKGKNSNYDLIYYDAFGPKVQPDLWNEQSLKKMFELLKPSGILITYCAQGQFKRNLKSVGFEVESLAGPPGKREITRAIKNAQ